MGKCHRSSGYNTGDLGNCIDENVLGDDIIDAEWAGFLVIDCFFISIVVY
jgi:hypothetical protein